MSIRATSLSRVLTVLAVVAAGFLAAIIAPAGPAAASCNLGAAHYAGEYTSTSNRSYSDGCGQDGPKNTTWRGVDGQIKTPSTAPALTATTDHNAGWIGVYWNNVESDPNDDRWLQIGWMTGILFDGNYSASNCPFIKCLYCPNKYCAYAETKDGHGNYSVFKLEDLVLGSAHTYRVVYDSPSGCWRAYYNYNIYELGSCYLPTTGTMWAMNELGNNSGHAKMADSSFGSSTAGTNATLRLLGSAGFQDWDTSLTSGGTATLEDIGHSSGNNFYLAPVEPYYYLVTYQA